MTRKRQRALGAVIVVVACIATLAAVFGASPARAAADATASAVEDELHLDDLQAKGTHNSYRLRPKNGLAWLIPALGYAHSPLFDQLEHEGVRQFELDVNWHSARSRWLAFHIWFVDDATTCNPFTDCLEQIEAWSDANPAHHPITIMVEAKDELDLFGTQDAKLGLLDADIRSVFAEDDLITPDAVRGGHATLPAAIAAGGDAGWPTLEESRGKVLFALLANDGERAAYTQDRPALEGRAMFVTGDDETAPHAAWFKVDDPLNDADRIRELVEAGFLVRTRADDSAHHKSSYPARRDAAFASGAHFVSTDFPLPGRVPGLDYGVSVPGGTPSRCNPITAPPGCTPADIEDLGKSPPTMQVDVSVTGARRYENSGTIGSDRLFVGPRGAEPLGNLSGGGALDAPGSGTPSIDVDLFPIIPGFDAVTGTVRISDPAAGADLRLPVFVGRTQRLGANGVHLRATVVSAGFPFRIVNLDLRIEER